MDKRAILRQWLSSGAAALHPLTLPQRELWECSPVPPSDPSHNIGCLIQLRGLVTQSAWETAMQKVAARQEVLRLSILPGREQPVQLVRQFCEPNLTWTDATQCSDEAVEEIAAGLFREPFDLLQGPLYRTQLMQRGADNWLLALSMHHAIGDGWTLGLWVQDLCMAYIHGIMGASGGLPPLPLTYSAWGAAERAAWPPAEFEKRAAFWRANLEGRPRLWATADGPIERWVTNLPVKMADAAQELARATGATLYSTLLAVFRIALLRWSGRADTVVGTPVANRSTQAAREILGSFAGIVPMRAQVDSQRDFSGALRAMHEVNVDCFANAMPFAELARALGEEAQPGYNPVFEIRFALQNIPLPDVSMHGLSARMRMRSTGMPRLQLGCEITIYPTEMEVVWLHRPGLIPRSEVEDLARLFTALLDAACRSPHSRIADLQ